MGSVRMEDKRLGMNLLTAQPSVPKDIRGKQDNILRKISGFSYCKARGLVACRVLWGMVHNELRTSWAASFRNLDKTFALNFTARAAARTWDWAVNL